MSDVLRLTLADGRRVEAPVAVWLSAILQSWPAGPVTAICERVARIQADGRPLHRPDGGVALVVTPDGGGGG